MATTVILVVPVAAVADRDGVVSRGAGWKGYYVGRVIRI